MKRRKRIYAASSLEETPLNIASLSVRAQNVLTHNRIETVGQVLEMGEEGIMSLQNAGAKTVSEIMACAIAQADVHTTSEAFEMTIVDEVEPTQNRSADWITVLTRVSRCLSAPYKCFADSSHLATRCGRYY